MIVLVVIGLQASAETMYVRDTLYVNIHSGKGYNFRIIETGLPSGTKLERVRDEDDDQGRQWTLVESERGNQGWMESQYLQTEATANDRLAQAQQQLAALRNQQQGATGQIGELQNSNTQLTQDLAAARDRIESLTTELENIRSVSANALALNDSNQRLVEENQQLTTDLDVAEAQIERLQDQSNQKWFLNGALAVFIGCILTIIVQKIRVKRRYSEWA